MGAIGSILGGEEPEPEDPRVIIPADMRQGSSGEVVDPNKNSVHAVISSTVAIEIPPHKDFDQNEKSNKLYITEDNINAKGGQTVSLENSGHDLEDISKLNVASTGMDDPDGLSNTTENENKLLHSSCSTKIIENKASGLELSININES